MKAAGGGSHTSLNVLQVLLENLDSEAEVTA